VIASVLFIVLIIVKQKSFDNIGMAFLFGTSFQMLLCYLVLRPILQDKLQNTQIEKTNFFVTFILFLLFETLLTARLLNEKR
jgi:surface polysaccharide O-acyltransferase-like enzyme